MDKALLSETVWTPAPKPYNVASRILLTKYGNFRELHRTVSSTTFVVWKSLHSSKETLRKGMAIKIGDGLNTRTWTDDPRILGNPNSLLVVLHNVNTDYDMKVANLILQEPEDGRWEMEYGIAPLPLHRINSKQYYKIALESGKSNTFIWLPNPIANSLWKTSISLTKWTGFLNWKTKQITVQYEKSPHGDVQINISHGSHKKRNHARFRFIEPISMERHTVMVIASSIYCVAWRHSQWGFCDTTSLGTNIKCVVSFITSPPRRFCQ